MKKRLQIVLAWLLLPFLSLLSCQKQPSSPPDFELICLEVGQGSGTLLRTREGDILIDAGPEQAQEELCLRLQALGVERLSLLILSHMDEDHIGGADGVLRTLAVERVWVNGSEEQNESRRQLEAALLQCGLAAEAVKAGDFYLLGGVTVTVLSPWQHGTVGNEGSLVLRLVQGDLRALWMGDAGVETEQALLQAYGPPQLQAELLQVGHHGSDTSSSAAFLEAVQPKYAVISCGAGNSYGHPDGRALARLRDVGAIVLRTDLMGEITFQASNGALLPLGMQPEISSEKETEA